MLNRSRHKDGSASSGTIGRGDSTLKTETENSNRPGAGGAAALEKESQQHDDAM